MIPQSPFKRLVLRAVLRDVYPMVIRLVAVPDFLALSDFDDLFHAVLGWESGAGYAFRLHGQEFNSLRRQTKSKRLSDFRLHQPERFLYSLGFMDQGEWEWEVRVLDSQDGTEGDEKLVSLDVGVQHRRSIAVVPPDTACCSGDRNNASRWVFQPGAMPWPS